MRRLRLIVLGFVAGLSTAGAEDKLKLEGAEIRGNRELPKVLNIVPWKGAEGPELVGRPVESLLDEALAPVDREVFQRTVAYHGLLAKQK
jgi:hypothetical protein